MQVDATQLFSPLSEDEFVDIYVSGMSIVQSIEVITTLVCLFVLMAVLSLKCQSTTH